MPRKSYFSSLPPLSQDQLSQELEKYRLSLVSFGYFRSTRPKADKNTTLPYHRIIYITCGPVRYEIHNTSMVLEKGDVLYTPPNTIYNAAGLHDHVLPEFLYLYFQVLPHHEEKHFIRMMETSLKIRVFHALRSPVEFYFRTIEEEYASQRPGYYHKIHSYLMLLIMELLRRKDFRPGELQVHKPIPGTDLILNKAASYIAANIREPLRISQVSHACGVSESYLYKIFVSGLGQSPKEYILKCKMEDAALLLKEQNMTVTQIARELGFTSPNHFSNTFYKVMGIRPSRYVGNSQGTEP